jgi:hypothetical protein
MLVRRRAVARSVPMPVATVLRAVIMAARMVHTLGRQSTLSRRVAMRDDRMTRSRAMAVRMRHELVPAEVERHAQRLATPKGRRRLHEQEHDGDEAGEGVGHRERLRDWPRSVTSGSRCGERGYRRFPPRDSCGGLPHEPRSPTSAVPGGRDGAHDAATAAPLGPWRYGPLRRRHPRPRSAVGTLHDRIVRRARERNSPPAPSGERAFQSRDQGLPVSGDEVSRWALTSSIRWRTCNEVTSSRNAFTVGSVQSEGSTPSRKS